MAPGVWNHTSPSCCSEPAFLTHHPQSWLTLLNSASFPFIFCVMQVPEFWHTTPEDGGVYYVLRPPWIRSESLQTFFTMFPGERHWATSFSVQARGVLPPCKKGPAVCCAGSEGFLSVFLAICRGHWAIQVGQCSHQCSFVQIKKLGKKVRRSKDLLGEVWGTTVFFT